MESKSATYHFTPLKHYEQYLCSQDHGNGFAKVNHNLLIEQIERLANGGIFFDFNSPYDNQNLCVKRSKQFKF